MDHRRKLEWARQHLDALEEEITAFRNSEPYALGVKFDAQFGGYVGTLRDVKPTPTDWSLMLGDIVHNTRSALDALTYALACKNLGRTPTKDEVKVIQFVIVDAAGAWPKERDRRLRCLSGAAQAAIERFQPYHRTDLTQRHPLSVLRDLSNIDKHRHILIAVASASSSAIVLSGEFIDGERTVEGYIGPLEEGTVIARWKYVLPGGVVMPPHLYAHAKVDAYGKLGLDVQFARTEATPVGGSAMSYLLWLVGWIESDVFPPLEALL